MGKRETVTEAQARPPSLAGPTFREMAREEFWIVAKSFFAPIYGTYLVWRRLLRLTKKVDRQALAAAAPEPPLQPAE
jgi:hypothetical protein